jgi:chemotaxis protein CheX
MGRILMVALALPETLDLKAAGPLKSAFLERRGDSVEIEASQVRRLGGLCLQILLAARKAWSDDGKVFSITGPSEAFLETIRLFGAEGALLSTDIHGAKS